MNEKQYEETLALIDGLMDAKPNTPDEAELERLSLLVEEYEDEHYPIEVLDVMKPHIVKSDDGCISIGWYFENHRFEIILDPIIRLSSWLFVGNKAGGDITKGDYIPPKFFEALSDYLKEKMAADD